MNHTTRLSMPMLLGALTDAPEEPSTYVVSGARPPLELHVEVRDADNVATRWHADKPSARDHPDGITFTTKRFEGFSTASCRLPRRIDRDYVDLSLFDNFALIGYDGSVAFDGRVASQPRSFDASHTIDVNATGWMSHARDRKFMEIYVDRDPHAWTGPAAPRRAALLTNNFMPNEPEQVDDPAAGVAGHATSVNGGWVAPWKPVSEGWYDAGPGLSIGQIAYCWKRESAAVDHNDTLWSWTIGAAIDSGASVYETTADLQGGGTPQPGPSCGALGLTSRYRYAFTQLRYDGTPAGSDGVHFSLLWYKLAVFGGHNLPQYLSSSDIGNGLRGSDVIVDILSRFCPQLNVGIVETTNYALPHLVFRDRVAPYEAIQEINKFTLWDFAVWENRRFYYGPASLVDYDWEVRLSDVGTTVQLQGDSTEDLANGIVVQFVDVATGRASIVTPDDYVDLKDVNPDNPANEHGLKVWTEIQLTSPTTTDGAIQVGRLALAEFNQPKAPGSITIAGHVKDRAGHWQQGWKVRAGDTIAITDHPNSRPRLIAETSWDHTSKRLTVSVDSTVKRLDAIIDRQATALASRGLG